MQAETAIHQGQQRAYYRRLVRLTPVLARRAVRKENLVFHTIRTLDRTEQLFVDYYEEPVIHAAERIEEWWHSPRNIFWYIRLP